MESKVALFEDFEFDIWELSQACLITIDGDQGAGKTSLASWLSISLDRNVISLDDYLSGDSGSYLDQLCWEKLKNNLENSLMKPVILEGVLMNQVLERLAVQSGYRIFTKCIINGQWIHQRYLSKTVNLPESVLSREIVSYYRQFSPWVTADFIYDPDIIL